MKTIQSNEGENHWLQNAKRRQEASMSEKDYSMTDEIKEDIFLICWKHWDIVVDEPQGTRAQCLYMCVLGGGSDEIIIELTNGKQLVYF